MVRRSAIALLAALGAVVASGCSPRPAAAGRAATPRAVGPGGAVLEADVVARVNRHRVKQGLAPLAVDERIVRQARAHSLAMAEGAVPAGHDGFDERVEALRRTVRCRTVAENVAQNRGYRDAAAAAFGGWLTSRGHRATIEGPYESTGVGVARDRAGTAYVTQIFCGVSRGTGPRGS
jgi:uncharacterized protein YkwD